LNAGYTGSAKQSKVKRFADIYTERGQDAGWSVVQAATLLAEARSRRCSSLVIYAALELRLALEQLLFTIIVVSREKVEEQTLQECRKKDGLFRVLEQAAPAYSKRCRFTNVLSSFNPGIPQVAEWDVRSMKRYYTALSDLCHSQLVIRGMDVAPAKWDKEIALLEEVYEFLAEGMRKGTGCLSLKTAPPFVFNLWEKYSSGEISLENVRARFSLLRPLF
jgi:hypothetical protein